MGKLQSQPSQTRRWKGKWGEAREVVEWALNSIEQRSAVLVVVAGSLPGKGQARAIVV